MLVIQASESNSEPSHAYKMDILAKIVHGLLNGWYQDIKGLSVWTLESEIQVI